MRRRPTTARSGCRRRDPDDARALLARSRRRRMRRVVRGFERGLAVPLGRGCAQMIDTLRLTAEEAMSMLASGDVSAEELHAAYAGRDDDVHAYLRRVEYAGAEGISIALKDVIGTRGVETTAGSKILRGYVPVYDSTVAARVKEAGLPLLGKTNTDEF